jgi:hypothetical protein
MVAMEVASDGEETKFDMIAIEYTLGAHYI